jgi:crotonobetainyl-CoA:carnitine CoA-transferase CaiB-like acyl-CoA transferase
MLGVPVKLSATPGRPQGPAPLLGEHSEQICLDLGIAPEQIAALEKNGILKTYPG